MIGTAVLTSSPPQTRPLLNAQVVPHRHAEQVQGAAPIAVAATVADGAQQAPIPPHDFELFFKGAPAQSVDLSSAQQAVGTLKPLMQFTLEACRPGLSGSLPYKVVPTLAAICEPLFLKIPRDINALSIWSSQVEFENTCRAVQAGAVHGPWTFDSKTGAMLGPFCGGRALALREAQDLSVWRKVMQQVQKLHAQKTNQAVAVRFCDIENQLSKFADLVAASPGGSRPDLVNELDSVAQLLKESYANLPTPPMGLVHGDLHYGNVLLNQDGSVQLTDFSSTNYADTTGDAARWFCIGGIGIEQFERFFDAAAMDCSRQNIRRHQLYLATLHLEYTCYMLKRVPANREAAYFFTCLLHDLEFLGLPADLQKMRQFFLQPQRDLGISAALPGSCPAASTPKLPAYTESSVPLPSWATPRPLANLCSTVPTSAGAPNIASMTVPPPIPQDAGMGSGDSRVQSATPTAAAVKRCNALQRELNALLGLAENYSSSQNGGLWHMADSFTLADSAYPLDSVAADAFKAKLVAALLAEPDLARARDAAKVIAHLHNKPHHAREIETTIKALLADEPANIAILCDAAHLVVLGEAASSTALLRDPSMRLSPEQKYTHLQPILGRAVEITRKMPGGAAAAACIKGTDATSLAPYMHVCRTIAAMSAPRAWRVNATHCDGRMTFDEIVQALKLQDTLPGRHKAVTAKLIKRYRAWLAAQ